MTSPKEPSSNVFHPPWEDAPGTNVTLRPTAAPAWLRPALRAGDAVDPSRRVNGAATSAVLVVVTGHTLADAAVILTHRSPSLRSHSGQIAFPGGHVEPSDRGPVDTALREAWEEIGLNRAQVTPLAVWPAISVRSKKKAVVPVLAHWAAPSPDNFGMASPAETDHVFSVPISHLADPANRLRVHARGWVGPAFAVERYVVWGFTASVLDALLDAAGWAKPWGMDEPVDLYDTLKQSRNRERMD